MIDLAQFRAEIVRPTLKALDMWSASAEILVVGTALVESGLRYLRQIEGPALGFYQVEPATHDDLSENWLRYRPEIAGNAMLRPRQASRMVYDLRYATAICRLIYWRRPEALPPPRDLEGMAQFWKAHYNTALGKGDPAKFVRLAKEHEL